MGFDRETLRRLGNQRGRHDALGADRGGGCMHAGISANVLFAGLLRRPSAGIISSFPLLLFLCFAGVDIGSFCDPASVRYLHSTRADQVQPVAIDGAGVFGDLPRPTYPTYDSLFAPLAGMASSSMPEGRKRVSRGKLPCLPLFAEDKKKR